MLSVVVAAAEDPVVASIISGTANAIRLAPTAPDVSAASHHP
ncbi:hypothetical protein [Bifidobacterium longum]|nr:hypothetical protein [Bifidobacterium longum]